jgi:hypothetical protein
MNLTGIVQPSKKMTGNMAARKVITGTCKSRETVETSDHITTTANPVGTVAETVPEVVTYTIEE